MASIYNSQALRTNKEVTERQPGFGEKLAATFALGVERTPVNSILRGMENAYTRSKDSEKIEPDELNKMFPALEGKFNQPENIEYARLINERHRRTKSAQDIIERGEDSFAEEATMFVTSMVPDALDPINVALGAVTGLGIGKVVSKALGSSITGVKKLGTDIAENVVSNLVTEFGITNPVLDQELKDYSTEQSLVNAVGAGVAFPILAAPVKAIFKHFSGNGKLDNLTKSADQQLAMGKRVEMTESIEAIQHQEKLQTLDEMETLGIEGQEKQQLMQMETNLPDRTSVSEQANSRQADLYFDKEIEQYHNPQTAALFDASETTMIKKRGDELLEQMESEAVEGQSFPELDEFRAVRETEQDFRTAQKAFIECITQGN